MGRVDVLVANAGGGRGWPMDTKASSLDPALLQLVTEMNLFGTVYSCNAVAPVMKQQRSGKIITVSSVAGTAPSADGCYAHYGAAKAAIAPYTRYLAQNLGLFGIVVNCPCTSPSTRRAWWECEGMPATYNYSGRIDSLCKHTHSDNHDSGDYPNRYDIFEITSECGIIDPGDSRYINIQVPRGDYNKLVGGDTMPVGERGAAGRDGPPDLA